jgi:ABC-type oligopeptide transport system ATPase subunit
MTGPVRDAPLLEVTALTKEFAARRGMLGGVSRSLPAVDGVDLLVHRGESYGLVGESGSGKTTVARCVIGLIRPSSGLIRFEGRDISRLSGVEQRRARARMQIVFQDPYSSLNPRMTVGRIIAEPLVIHGVGTPRERDRRLRELADLVGLKPDHLYRYPHEFSGGQRQRIAIARSMAVQPALLILDEPTSALDVSVQAQILNLLNDLQKLLGLTYLMISHDLGVIRHMCDRVAVMYQGRIVELSSAENLFNHAIHPYTRALLATLPRMFEDGWSAAAVPPPSVGEFPSGGDLAEVEADHWVRTGSNASN